MSRRSNLPRQSNSGQSIRYSRNDRNTRNDSSGSDDDTEHVIRKTRQVKNESLESTRRALRRLQETEELASKSHTQLNEQSESLYKIELGLAKSSHHINESNQRTDDINHYNRRLFTPGFRFNLKSKRDKQKKEYEKEVGEIEQDRKGRFANPNRSQGISQDDRAAEQERTQIRSQIQYDDSDDEGVQGEIDQNLQYMSGALGRLKMMGLSMQEDLNEQNDRLKRINSKAEDVNERVKHNDARLKKILKKR